MKHPDWCGVKNELSPNADYCLKCDDYDDFQSCEDDHPKEIVHRWELTDNFFGFSRREQCYVWISQKFNEKKPRAWKAEMSLDEADAQEVTSDELAEISKLIGMAAKIVK
jgi:hypothetical protein